MNGIELIEQERARQIEVEGWTAEHDAAHPDGTLAKAAATYALDHYWGGAWSILWPFGDEWWKPGTELHNLIKAGALIAAEIDRLLAKLLT